MLDAHCRDLKMMPTETQPTPGRPALHQLQQVVCSKVSASQLGASHCFGAQPERLMQAG